MAMMLHENGYNPIVFDNLSTGHADAVSFCELFVGDIRSESDLNSFFSKYDIQVVIHFAALAYVGESVVDPEKYYQNNVSGSINLLEKMRKHALKKIVFSSSCATYGIPNELPLIESASQLPINPYGQTKLIFENMLKDYAKAYDLNSISLRYFNAAGCDRKGRLGERHNPETHLIPLVLAEALRVKEGGIPDETRLTIFGEHHSTADGSCVRDYVHVEDLCRAHLSAVQRLMNKNGEIGAEFYNLANGLGFSVLEVIESCRNVTKMPIKYRVQAAREGDPSALVGNSQLANRVLNWYPEYLSLDDIIKTAWDWMLSQVPVSDQDSY